VRSIVQTLSNSTTVPVGQVRAVREEAGDLPFVDYLPGQAVGGRKVTPVDRPPAPTDAVVVGGRDLLVARVSLVAVGARPVTNEEAQQHRDQHATQQ